MSMMARVSALLMTVTDFYKDLNPSTLSGAIDILVVEHPDGELVGSPFHVRFGKLQLLRAQEKLVEVRVNGKVADLKMKVGEAGEAFFVVESNHPGPEDLATSPIPQPATVPAHLVEPLDLDACVASRPTSPTDSPVPPAPPLATLDAHGPAPSDPVPAPSPSACSESSDALAGSLSAASEITPDSTSTILVPLRKRAGGGKKDSTESIHPFAPTDDLPIEADTADPSAPPPSHPEPGPAAPHSAAVSELEYLSMENGMLLDPATDPMSSPSGQMALLETPDDARPAPLHENALGADATDLFPESKAAVARLQPIPPTTEHPFSDSEIDPHASSRMQPARSQLSDTEVEFHESSAIAPTPAVAEAAQQQSLWSWAWGKMPVKGTSPTTPTESESVRFRAVSTDTPTYAMSFDDEKAPLQLSLCGYKQYITPLDFYSKLVTYEQLCQNPALLSSHELVLRMNEKFYPWNAVGPTFASMLLFQKPLPESILEQMVLEQREKRSSWRNWWSRSSVDDTLAPKPIQQQQQQPQQQEQQQTLPALTITSPTSILGPNLVTSSPTKSAYLDPTLTMLTPSPQPSQNQKWLSSERRTFSDLPMYTPTTSATYAATSPGSEPPTRPASARSQPPGSTDLHAMHVTTPTSDTVPSPTSLRPPSPLPTSSPSKYYHKSLRLTSEQLKALGLRKGCNLVTYSVHTPLQGVAVCRSRIFLWASDERVVISDIDGTITKSDALGHFFTMLGRDWTHSGVASLYTSIHHNGYQLLYLTSRAIGQAQFTRNYLNKVEQGRYQLPDGPVFLSPDRLLAALTREVIQRRPEEFKIACLRDIRGLFPSGTNPFHAGFGNRSTDAFSYRAVGVPANRIFHINANGEVRREWLEGYRATYFQLNDLVDQIFPPLTTVLDQEFNDWQFWKTDLPVHTDDDDEEGEEEEEEVSFMNVEEGGEGAGDALDQQTMSTNSLLKEADDLDRVNEFIAYPYL